MHQSWVMKTSKPGSTWGQMTTTLVIFEGKKGMGFREGVADTSLCMDQGVESPGVRADAQNNSVQAQSSWSKCCTLSVVIFEAEERILFCTKVKISEYRGESSGETQQR